MILISNIKLKHVLITDSSTKRLARHIVKVCDPKIAKICIQKILRYWNFHKRKIQETDIFKKIPSFSVTKDKSNLNLVVLFFVNCIPKSRNTNFLTRVCYKLIFKKSLLLMENSFIPRYLVS